eukprot:gnl/TRDRNA2_/TRDRNA2_59765_c1_seq1.p1 gnl/TRDRNA2_/TRDRNA2_59765_c1~~gnl/TRDRNA2_/TRDRNA2_59765_c1_seq1.p1  ORF type:complete len:418 (+),score=57.92 gnl/TRDRNA2_/TRDRNA2_59765_c1_seq1:1-1254(+)
MNGAATKSILGKHRAGLCVGALGLSVLIVTTGVGTLGAVSRDTAKVTTIAVSTTTSSTSSTTTMGCASSAGINTSAANTTLNTTPTRAPTSGDSTVVPNPVFSVVVPLYVYPRVWPAGAERPQLAEAWQTVDESLDKFPDVKQYIIVNPDSGAGFLSDPNSDWQAAVEKIAAHGNAHLLAYVPTGYGEPADISHVEKMVRAAMSNRNWHMKGIFFDEVNGQDARRAPHILETQYRRYVEIAKSLVTKNNLQVVKMMDASNSTLAMHGDADNRVQRSTATMSGESVAGADVALTTVFNFGSRAMADGTEYGADWLDLADISCLYEADHSGTAQNTWRAYAPSASQEKLPRSKFMAILRNVDFGKSKGSARTASQQFLRQAWEKHFGVIYLTDEKTNYNSFVGKRNHWQEQVAAVSEFR